MSENVIVKCNYCVRPYTLLVIGAESFDHLARLRCNKTLNQTFVVIPLHPTMSEWIQMKEKQK